MWKELKLDDPRMVVEIGVGTGFFAFPFARKMITGKLFACDTQFEMLIWLKEHLPLDIGEHIVPVKMAGNVVPLFDAIADLVYMINVHHELDDRMAIMRESIRILKPGGTVMVVDWKKGESPVGPPQEIRVTEEEIVQDVEAAGFRDVLRHPVLQYHNFVTGKKP